MFDSRYFTDNYGNRHSWRPERLAYLGLGETPPRGAPSASLNEPEQDASDNDQARPDWQEAYEEIMTLSSAIAAAQARIIELMTTHGGFLTAGDEPVTWLAWAAGMRPTTAKKHMRLGERLVELPKIKESFAAGEISFEKAETIARIASKETEEHLLIWAQHGTCSQLGTIASGFRRAKVNLEGAAALQRDRYLTYYYTEEGGFRLRAQMPAEQGAVVAAAIEAAEEKLWEEQQVFTDHELSEADTRQMVRRGDTGGARRADALVALGETFLEHGLSDRPVSDRYQVMVHVDQAALIGDAGATCEVDGGAGISAETARRISCDCSIMALLEEDGIPLKLGRTRRTISPALRRALEARDRHCVFPGCTNSRRTDAHHVRHWVDEGTTDLDNLTLLCRRHHRLLHEGRYMMTFDGKTARFYRPEGTEVERAPTYPSLSEVEIAEWCAASSTDIDTWSHWIDPCDYGDAVSWLCENDLASRGLGMAGARAGPE